MRRARFSPVPNDTDLPVLLPSADRLMRRVAAERAVGAPMLRLDAWHGVVLVLIFLCAASMAEAAAIAPRASVLATLLKWTPLLLRGFAFNLAISFFAMAIGTALGAFLGLGQISLMQSVRKSAWVVVHFFRNAPWLVLLFYCMFLLPFQMNVLGHSIPLPDWIKATLGLALPVMANVAEIVRGAVQSIPTGQWESASSLAFGRQQTIWLIILPQCVKRMLPPWMNLYAILTMSTVLASVVGVNEVMTLTGDVLSSENRPELLLPFYSYILIWFFLYCYPIARWTARLERRFAVNI
jgi:polar amino acid transport system permease protein